MTSKRLVVAFSFLFTAIGAQNWNYLPGQQIPGFPPNPGSLPSSSFLPLPTNGLQQAFPMKPFGQLQPPRMQLARIHLTCEITVPSQPSPVIRWIRQGSAAMISTPITIAEGQNSVDPIRYQVNVETLPSGASRSVLTILQPDPDSNQAAFYCQSVFSGDQAVQSREIYVIGSRQFVNANLAYHAAETTPYVPRTASVNAPEPVHPMTHEMTTIQPMNEISIQ